MNQRCWKQSLVVLCLGLVSVSAGAAAQKHDEKAAKPVRTVNGQVLTSTAMPAVAIEFDEEFKYAGTQSFVLYDVANCEQHFF
ncbi:MAG TPA: hypothetical protein VFU38_05595, partial [Candidatus Krumholzibacteria bacterium]|nr:hypothetical protein [Candidatus Krumholzibacteria bacterium]